MLQMTDIVLQAGARLYSYKLVLSIIVQQVAVS
jgi:hypothetical protein